MYLTHKARSFYFAGKAIQGRDSFIVGIVTEVLIIGLSITSCCSDPQSQSSDVVMPEKLIIIIKEQQKKNVKESYGEEAYECFTVQDLEQFVSTRTIEKIINRLKKTKEFKDVVLAIRTLSSGDQKKLLELGLNTFKKTWTEIGRIDPEGTTEAGQTAEKMIAQAIVNLVKQEVPQQCGIF